MSQQPHACSPNRSEIPSTKSCVPYTWLQRCISALCLLALCLSTGCLQRQPGTGGGGDVPRNPYVPPTSSTRVYNWLVVRCQLNDAPTIPAGLDDDIVKFLSPAGVGLGNIQDYFHDISYNHASVVGDVSVPWVTAPFGSKNYPGRTAGVQQCLAAIPGSKLPNLDNYYGVVVVSNFVQDGGACYIGQSTLNVRGFNHNLACLWFDPKSLKTEFAAHEFAHGLGLNHSYDDSQRNCGGLPGEYCDPWDIMSAQGTYQFLDKNFPIGGQPSGSGPGMVAPNLLTLGWLDVANQRAYYIGGSPDQTIKLRALTHPSGNEPLVLFVQTDDPDPTQNLFTVEYRQGDSWDSGFFTDTNTPQKVRDNRGVVLVHHYNKTGFPVTTLINGPFSGAMIPCDTMVLANANRFVHVDSFNLADGSATVTVGTGRGGFLPCFRNLITQKYEPRLVDHDDDDVVKTNPNLPTPPRAPVVANPPVPPHNPIPPR